MSTNGKSEAEANDGKKTCFIVCPIGSDISPQRKHSDQTLRHIIAPVLQEAGFEEAVRADKISESGNITRQIINHIREDSLVIADLTGHNPNVFYELAIRHCTGRPFIQMIRKGESIPFDLGPMRTIMFDLTDPDDVVASREELRRQVASAMAEGAQVDTPIGAAMDFEKLRSGTDTDRLLSQVIQRLDTIEGGKSANRLNIPYGTTEAERIVQTAVGRWRHENKEQGEFDEQALNKLAEVLDRFLSLGVDINPDGIAAAVDQMSAGQPASGPSLHNIIIPTVRAKPGPLIFRAT